MIRKVVIIIIVAIIISVATGMGKQIYEALQVGERLSKAAEDLNLRQATNRDLKQKLAEVEDETFVEEQARNKLNLAKDGETIVIIPQDEIDKAIQVFQPIVEAQRPNWEKWLKLIFP